MTPSTHFVDPDYIDRGIGTQLRQTLVQHARNTKIKVLKIPSTLTTADFYEKLDFTVQKTISQNSGSTILMTKQRFDEFKEFNKSQKYKALNMTQTVWVDS